MEICMNKARKIQQLVINALDDLKAVDLLSIDVSDRCSVTDIMVICSGTSSRHVKSLTDNVIQKTRAAGVVPLGVEGETAAEWALVDLGDVVVHIMLPDARDFYQLERLWLIGEAH